jgi:glutathione S-transferase
MVLPRPELAAIGVNYRRIPALAAGKDVYCDSQAIIDYLTSTSSKNITGNPASDYAMKFLGDTIFRTALLCIQPQSLTPEFIADRKPVFALLDSPELKSGSLRPQGLSGVHSLLTRFECEALGGGTRFICGDRPTLQDAHVAWAVRFSLFGMGLEKEPGLRKTDMPKLYVWLEDFIQETKFEPKDISADEATKEILGAEKTELKQSGREGEDPTGLKVCDRVAVNQMDAEMTHPVVGKLALLSLDEIVVEVESGVRVHFPCVGQRVEKA